MIGLAAAQAWVEQNFDRLGAEPVPLASASGRVLAASRPPLPPPPIAAAIDGFAVRAATTEGASDYAPLPVQAVPIVSGARLPPGTDAVLPAHWFEAGSALGAVAAGEGVAAADPLAVPAGVLRPVHLAALALRGETMVDVVRRPVVRLRVAGPKAGADALTPLLGALVAASGGRVAEGAPDLVLHAGRSGPGADDDGAAVFESVFARGVHLRPGETTTLGTIDGTPALLLPGDPLACLIAFALLAAPALRRLGGRPEPATMLAALGRKIVSGLGQVDAVRVRVRDGVAMPAGPSLAADADGLVVVPEGSEGYPAGATVAISALP